jgi:hypothetical protein
MKFDSLMETLKKYIDSQINKKFSSKASKKINEELFLNKGLRLKDGITVPDTDSNYAVLYIDTSDGDLKIKFADGTVKTITTDT